MIAVEVTPLTFDLSSLLIQSTLTFVPNLKPQNR